MQYRTLGRTGLTISEVGFGTAPAGIKNYLRSWNPETQAGQDTFASAVRLALQLGYTFFDTAPAYGNGEAERQLGEALGPNRKSVILATKVSSRLKGAEEIFQSVDESLARLKTDYVDLLQIHGDYEQRFHSDDCEHILHGAMGEALVRLREAGKARFLGITGEYCSTLMPFLGSTFLDVVQIKYNLLYQEAFHTILPACEAHNVGVLVMRPNTSGIFEKYLRQTCPDAAGSFDPNKLSLNYVLSDRRVDCAIAGMRSESSVRHNAALSDEQRARVDLFWLHERTAGTEQAAWTQPE